MAPRSGLRRGLTGKLSRGPTMIGSCPLIPSPSASR
jgi:hypothetical protein